MSKNLNTKSRRQSVKEHITRELDKSQAEFKEQYEKSLLENNPSNIVGSDPANVTTSIPEVTGEISNKPKMEEKVMAKNFDFDEEDKFNADVKDATKLPDDIPPINDDGKDSEEKNEDEKKTENSNGEAIKGKYDDDLTDLAEKKIVNFSNIQVESSKVSALLKNNLMIKQFVTNNTFGRGFVLSLSKDNNNNQTAHYKIENLKPGRAKSVVITLPRKLQEVLTESAKKSIKTLRSQLLAATNDGDLTAEEKADTVDMVIGYDDLMSRVANLCEGQIAEFGGKGGVLDTDETVKYNRKVDPATGDSTFEKTDITANQAVEFINGKKTVMYTMTQPGSKLMAAAISGEALSEKSRKVITRFKSGKTPLKRTKGAFSALYTPKNFVSISQYEEVAPFAGEITKETAQRLSAKAAYKLAKLDKSATPIDSYDSQMFGDTDIAAVFDPSVPADTRYDTLTVARNYQPKNADGTVRIRKVAKKDATGKLMTDADGKRIYEEVPETARDIILVDRMIRDFYTGRPLTQEEAKNAKFVLYGEKGKTKDGKDSSPRVQKKRISFAGLETEVNAPHGIIGTFGLDDSSVSSFVNLVGEEIAKEAFVKAASRNSSGGDNTVASDYEDGMLAALLASTTV